MLPEIRSLLGRAGTNRYLLEQLVSEVGDDRWESRAEGDSWTARAHLAHLATADTVTGALLRAPGDGAYRLDAALQEQRLLSMTAAYSEPIAAMVERLSASRQELSAFIAAMDADALAIPVLVSVVGGWPPERHYSTRAYLAAWAEHDAEHTMAIRAAIAVPPSAQDLALAARFGRR